jgi:hypothetical protein
VLQRLGSTMPGWGYCSTDSASLTAHLLFQSAELRLKLAGAIRVLSGTLSGWCLGGGAHYHLEGSGGHDGETTDQSQHLSTRKSCHKSTAAIMSHSWTSWPVCCAVYRALAADAVSLAAFFAVCIAATHQASCAQVSRVAKVASLVC